MMRYLYITLLLCIACNNSDDTRTDSSNTDVDAVYFPPIDGSSWNTISPGSLGWNENDLNELDTFLENSNTKAFIILKNGRIVLENYYQASDVTTLHRWNSAAKTLTASTIGIAQDQGYLTINHSTQDYLGDGWTTMTSEQEAAITVKNQLSMTTGGDYTLSNSNCTDPQCLRFYTDPGTNWYYHNAFYTLLQQVVTEATSIDFKNYFDSEIQSKIGMNGFWFDLGYFRLFSSNARDMARFGLLSLNRGNWDGEQLIPASFFTEMTTPSQSLNKAYGYLWWLNGQADFKLPSSTNTFSGKLIPTAPDDLIAGLGKDDQKMYVLPSEQLVIIRLGDATGSDVEGPSGYDTELWSKIMEVID